MDSGVGFAFSNCLAVSICLAVSFSLNNSKFNMSKISINLGYFTLVLFLFNLYKLTNNIKSLIQLSNEVNLIYIKYLYINILKRNKF